MRVGARLRVCPAPDRTQQPTLPGKHAPASRARGIDVCGLRRDFHRGGYDDRPARPRELPGRRGRRELGGFSGASGSGREPGDRSRTAAQPLNVSFHNCSWSAGSRPARLSHPSARACSHASVTAGSSRNSSHPTRPGFAPPCSSKAASTSSNPCTETLSICAPSMLFRGLPDRGSVGSVRTGQIPQEPPYLWPSVTPCHLQRTATPRVGQTCGPGSSPPPREPLLSTARDEARFCGSVPPRTDRKTTVPPEAILGPFIS
jgi:hypothetical protein